MTEFQTAPVPLEWVFVYTREAHPGEIWPEHGSFEQKRRHALAFKQQLLVLRRIVIDSLDGQNHRRYGVVPNTCFVVDPHGRLVFKSSWTVANLLHGFLSSVMTLERWRSDPGASAPMIQRFTFAGLGGISYEGDTWAMYLSGLRRNGPRALLDWARVMVGQQDRRT